MTDLEVKGWLFTLAIAVVVCVAARGLKELEHKFDTWMATKRGDLIPCDICDEMMKPDGLHEIEDRRLFFPSFPRIYRHPLHIIRTQILKQPIYGDPKQRRFLKRRYQ